jgi:hypothetical protein
MNFYRQCVLKKESTVDIAWIPEQFARIDKILRIGTEDGWVVVGVGFMRQPEDMMLEHEREYLKHRSVTDI